MKKIFIALGIVLLLVIGALVAIPFFFKDDIIAAVKQAANDSLTATLEFDDVDVSVFRDFPKLSVGLEGLKITNGPGHFEGVRLIDCKRLDVAVDLWAAVFNGKIIIRSLALQQPKIKVYALSDGSANYDITKPDPTVTTTTSSNEDEPIQLEGYTISDGEILYDDRTHGG
jgi:uncharacterized protein involved in outer membrane biogenesis